MQPYYSRQNDDSQSDDSLSIEDRPRLLSQLRQQRTMFRILAVVSFAGLIFMGILALFWKTHRATVEGPVTAGTVPFLMLSVGTAAFAARFGQQIRQIEQGSTAFLKPRKWVIWAGGIAAFIGWIGMQFGLFGGHLSAPSPGSMPEHTHSFRGILPLFEVSAALGLGGFLVAGFEMIRSPILLQPRVSRR